MATPWSDRGAGDLSMDQWNTVIDRLVQKKFLITVDPQILLNYLQGSGLSLYEKQLVDEEKSDAHKMSRLERFIRTRPSLREALCDSLFDLNSPLLKELEEEVLNVKSGKDSREQFRAALRQHDTMIETLAQWAIPHLKGFGCITNSDENDLESRRRQLIDILADKSKEDWNNFMEFLKTCHKDLHTVLKPNLPHQGPTVQPREEALAQSHPQIPRAQAAVSNGKCQESTLGSPATRRMRFPVGARTATPSGPVRFQVYNFTAYKDGRDFFCVFTFQQTPVSGKDLRAKLAKEMAAPVSTNLSVAQRRGSTRADDTPVVRCIDDDGQYTYVDGKGKRHCGAEVKGTVFFPLREDELPLLATDGDLHNSIEVRDW